MPKRFIPSTFEGFACDFRNERRVLLSGEFMVASGVLLPAIVFGFLVVTEEGVDNERDELFSAVLLDLSGSGCFREGFPVGPVRGHGVVGIGTGNDGSDERDVGAFQGERVSLPVVALVMVFYSVHHV